MDIQDIISSGLLELYVLGHASPKEARDVEAWAIQYPEIAAEIAAIERTMEIYAQANAIQPDDAVRNKVMAGIGVTATAASGNGIVKELYTVAEPAMRSVSSWKWAAAASIVLLLGSAVMNVMYYNKYDTASKDLASAKEQLVQEQQVAKNMKEDLDIVKNPYSQTVGLKPMDPMDAKAKIFWMENTGEVMIDASALPDAPNGMQYQFWAIVDGTPVDGGMIITNDKGKKFKMQKMKTFGKAQAFAISLEKEGGNPTPTHVVSMGKMI